MTLLSLTLVVSAVAVRATAQDSRTAGAATPSRLHPRTQALASRVPVREHCPGAQNAVGYYRRAYTLSRNRMNLAGAVPRHWYGCAAARRRSVMWRGRAHAAVLALNRWHTYQYGWTAWLPDKWQRIGACETGYGKRPGNWQHNSGAYQGAFGFARSSWDAFVPHADPKAGPYPTEAYQATPRQQYEVALAIYRRFGLSGWGCAGA